MIQLHELEVVDEVRSPKNEVGVHGLIREAGMGELVVKAERYQFGRLIGGEPRGRLLECDQVAAGLVERSVTRPLQAELRSAFADIGLHEREMLLRASEAVVVAATPGDLAQELVEGHPDVMISLGAVDA